MAAIACTAGPAQAQSLPDGFFTINGGGITGTANPDAHLANIAASGITAVRSDLLWQMVEGGAPIDGQRDIYFDHYENWVRKLDQHGLTWRPVFGAAPSWNRRPGPYSDKNPEPEQIPPEVVGTGLTRTAPFYTPPLVPELATQVMIDFFKRFGVGGTFWQGDTTPHPVRFVEAWNEPNMAPSKMGQVRYPAPTYAHFLMAVAAGAKSVDPGAQVVVGGLAPYTQTNLEGMSVRDFLNAVAASVPGVSALTSGVAVHIYPPHTASGLMDQLGLVRDMIDTTPFAQAQMHLNEFGGAVWSGPRAITETKRAALMLEMPKRAAAASGRACGIGSVAPYAWVTFEDANEDRGDKEYEDWFGIANRDGTDKPSAAAYADGIAASVAGDAPCGTLVAPLRSTVPLP